MKRLAECNPDAEIATILGTIPVALPIETISIRTNGEDKEIVAFVVPHQEMMEILTFIENILEERLMS